MTFPIPPLRLRSDVRLAPLQPQHAVDMLRWMQDPEIAGNLGLRREASLEATLAWIKNSTEDETVHAAAILFGIRHVGNVVLDRIDSYLNTARLSVYIGERSARRSGVGTAAIYLHLDEGFNRLGLHKVWLTVRCGNQRAEVAYRKLGFQVEGVLRDEFWYDGVREAVHYMGLLRDEFARLAVVRSDEA